MPIVPLPQETARLLRAHVVISTPVSVVKELIDNSIDAKATSIEVLVSRNTVDRIEVRDNGGGIETRDFEVLGRRGHTSKLRSVEELGTIGGTTLGFRGEAMAAMAAVAKVTVTTRTAADDTATVFELLTNGKGPLKNTIKSTPVGTTVVVSEMFGRLPVRKKVAIKDAKSTVVKMKHLLTAYALARPHLKLSIKEIGMALPCLSYSPRPGATMKSAAVCLFGSELAAQCVETTYNTVALTRRSNFIIRCAVGEPPEIHDGEIEIDALLPAQNVTPAKILNKAAFFSVDSRPVSPSRNLSKIYANFKRCIAKSLKASENSKQVKEPFIILNIKCPKGSYDVNLEPAKDDVLFTNEQCILDACDALFEQTYRLPPFHDESQRPFNLSPVNSVKLGKDTANINSRLKTARNVKCAASPAQPSDATCQSMIQASESSDTDVIDSTYTNTLPTKQAQSSAGHRWTVNMTGGNSSEDEDSLPTQKQPVKSRSPTVGSGTQSDSTIPTSPHQEEEASRPLDGVNPWMLAKMNAAIKQANGPNSANPGPQSTLNTLPSQSLLQEPQAAPPELTPGQALWDRNLASDTPISTPRFPAVRDLDFSDVGQSPVLPIVPAKDLTDGSVSRVSLPSGNRGQQESLSSSETNPQLTINPESNYQTPPPSSGAGQRPRGQKRSKRGCASRSGGPDLRQGVLFSRDVWGSNRPNDDSGGFLLGLHNSRPTSCGDLMPSPGSPEIQDRQPSELLSPSRQGGQHEAPSELVVTRGRNSRREPSEWSFVPPANPFSSIISLGALTQPGITTTGDISQHEAIRVDDYMCSHEPTSHPAMSKKSRSKSRGHSKRLKSSMLALETVTKDTFGLETWKDNFGPNVLLALEERLSAIDDYLITGEIQKGLLIDHDALGTLEEQLKSLLYDRLRDDSGQGCDCELDVRRVMAEKWRENGSHVLFGGVKHALAHDKLGR